MFLNNDEYLLGIFKDTAIISREDILNCIVKQRNLFQKEINSESEDREYYTTLDSLFENLYQQMEDSELFDAPEGGWRYIICYDSYGVELLLERVEFDEYKYDYYTEKNFWDSTEPFEQILICKSPAKMLTAEEYAKKHGVVLDTVRKWIRRGKLRCAIKNGRDWLVPELAQSPNRERGYKPAHYYWSYPLVDFPDGFEFLKDYNSVKITQFDNDKKKYSVEAKKGGKEDGVWRYANEIERLEAYLIANTHVTYAAPGYIITTK